MAGQKISDMPIKATLDTMDLVPIISNAPTGKDANYRFSIYDLLTTSVDGGVVRLQADRNLDAGIYLEDKGGLPNLGDCTAAFFAAISFLNTRGYGKLILQSGATYNITASAWALAGGRLTIPAGVSIEASGQGQAKVVFDGSDTNAGFAQIGGSNSRIVGLDIDMGNSAATCAIIQLDSGASAGLSKSYVQDCTIRNCASVSGYVNIINAHATLAMEDVGIRGFLQIVSATGNVPTGDRNDISKVHAAVYFNATAGGAIRRIRCERVFGDFRYIKMGIIVLGIVDGGSIDRPVIDSCGSAYQPYAGTTDAGYYAIAIYRLSSLRPRNIVIESPHIDTFVDCAIYLQNAEGITVSNGYFANQTNTVDGNFKRSAILKNGARKVKVTNCTFDTCARDITVSGPDEYLVGTTVRCDHTIDGVTTMGSVYASLVLLPGPSDTYGTWYGLTARNYKIASASGHGCLIVGQTSRGVGDVLIENSDLRVALTGQSARLESLSGAAGHGGITFSNVQMDGGLSVYVPNALSGALRFERCQFGAGGNTYDFQVAGNVQLHLIGNSFASTAANRVQIPAANIQGGSRAKDNTFASDCVAATHFMKAAPTHSLGGYVQNAVPAEAGTGGSKYVRSGWNETAAGTWLEDRTLTGN